MVLPIAAFAEPAGAPARIAMVWRAIAVFDASLAWPPLDPARRGGERTGKPDRRARGSAGNLARRVARKGAGRQATRPRNCHGTAAASRAFCATAAGRAGAHRRRARAGRRQPAAAATSSRPTRACSCSVATGLTNHAARGFFAVPASIGPSWNSTRTGSLRRLFVGLAALLDAGREIFALGAGITFGGAGDRRRMRLDR